MSRGRFRPFLLATALALASPAALAGDGAPADLATLSAQVRADPGDADARFRLAVALARAGHTAEALDEYDRLLAREPDNADYLLGRGQALLWAGRPDEAVVALQRAVALAPDYADAQAALASARDALDAPAPTPDEARARPRQVVQLEGRHDRLSDGFGPWTGWRLGWGRSDGLRNRIGAGVYTERRFGVRDSGVAVDGSVALDRSWTLSGDVAVAPGAQVLPSREGGVQLHRAWRGGWGTHVRLAHRHYADADVASLALGAERYVGAWRLAYTLGLTDVQGEPGTLTGHAIALDHFAEAGWQLGVRLASGREDARVGMALVPARVRSAALLGRHPLGHGWAMRWELGQARQGDFYDRTTLALGIEHAF